MAEIDEEAAERMLRNARLMLGIALLAALISVPALFAAKAGLFMVCWVASFLGGLGGVRDAARGSRGNVPMMYLSLVLVFVPGVNIVPLAYYLWRATKALSGDLEAAEPEAPAAARPARPASATPRPGVASAPRAAPAQRPVPGAATPAQARARLLTAIASVRLAGVDLQGADGPMLRVSIPNAPPGTEGSAPVMRATQGVFGVSYLIDQGDHYAHANVDELRGSGLTLDALHMVGVKNLARLVNGKPGLQVLPQADGVFGLVMGGQFEASLVLVDALWDEALRKHYKTAPVVTMPARDMLAFCDEGSAAGIEGLRAMAERIRTGGEGFMTDKLYVRKEGRWQELQAGKPGGDLPPLEFPR